MTPRKSILFFSTWALLLLFYYWRLVPLQFWIHSDQAVPYLMANTGFQWSDFFYWGTDRFGTPFSMLGKALFLLGGPIPFGWFYWSYIAVILAAYSSLWFTSLKPWAVLLLLALTLPMTGAGINQVLLPGSYYGGVIVFFALAWAGCARRNPILAGLGIVLLFYQYLMFGFLALGVLFCYFREDPTVWRQRAKTFEISFCLLFLAFLFLRAHAQPTDSFALFKMAPGPEAVASLKEIFFRSGLVLDGRGGAVGLWLLAFATFLGCLLLVRAKSGSQRWWALLLVGWTWSGLAFIGLNDWFFRNLRDGRYLFSVTLGSFFLLIILFHKKLLSQTWLLALLPLFLLKPMTLVGKTIDAEAYHGVPMKQIHAEALQLGCAGLIGKYWHTYFIGAWTDMKIIGTPYDTIRDREFHKLVLSKRPLCLADAEDARQQAEAFLKENRLECPLVEKNRILHPCHER